MLKVKRLSHYDYARGLSRAEQISHILYLQDKIKGCQEVAKEEGLSKLGRKYSARLYWSERELRQYMRAYSSK